MLVYLLVFLAVFILAIINLQVTKERMKPVYILLLIFFILYVGFRKDLGGSDYFVYKAYFNAVPVPWKLGSFSYFIHYRYFYKLLNSIVKIFTDQFFWFTLVIAIITLTILFKQTYKYLMYPFFGMIFYLYKTFFFTNFVVLRQSIAMMIFFIAIKYIIDRKFYKYVLIMLIATLFHTSAILLLPMYFINRINLAKFNPAKLVIISFIAGFVSKYILEALLFITKLLHVGPTIIGKVQGMVTHTGSMFNPHMIEAIAYVIIFEKIRKSHMNEKDKIFYNIFTIYVVTLFMFARCDIFIRVSMYFYIGIMYLMSRRLEYIKNAKVRLLFVYILGVIFLLGYIKYIISFNGGSLMPYRTIFTQGLPYM